MRRRRRGLRARVRDILAALVLLGGVALLSAWFAERSGVSPTGSARVIDGDSIEVGDVEIRLQGIDAPEYGQICKSVETNSNCGKQAAQWLRKLIGGRSVVCEGWEEDRYGRLLASCTVAGIELNRRMVRDGWAVSFGSYEDEELDASKNQRGIWAGEFERPSDWRKTRGDDDGAGVVEWLGKLLGF